MKLKELLHLWENIIECPKCGHKQTDPQVPGSKCLACDAPLKDKMHEQLGTPGWEQLYREAPLKRGGAEWPPKVSVGDKFKDKDGLIWKAVEVTSTGVNMELTTAPKAWGIRKFFITNKELSGFKKV